MSNKLQKFIVLTTQRSGSTWMVDMLNSTPRIKGYEELFLATWKKKPTWAGETDITPWTAYWTEQNQKNIVYLKPYYVFKYLDKVFAANNNELSAIGFKLMYSQIRKNLAILAYLLRYRIRLIHLIRSNYLNVLLSEKAVLLRGVPHTRNKVEQVQIYLDPVDLIEQLAWKEKKVAWSRNFFSHLGLPYMEITYEQLVADNQTFEHIFDFLKINPEFRQMKSNLKKLNQGGHKTLIENYEEVKNTLNSTKYSSLLN